MKPLIALLLIVIALSLSIQSCPAQPEPDPIPEEVNETLCIPGIVKCTKEDAFVCSGDGMSWNSCSGECRNICPDTFIPEISIDDYIREVNKRLKDPDEGYGFFGRISGYITNTFNGNSVYAVALTSFAVLLIVLMIYWRRMEG